MLGSLPESLEIDGIDYPIDADFRNILQIFLAFEDETLSDREKGFICLSRLFGDASQIPKKSIQQAYEAALNFLNYGNAGDTKEHRQKLMDWSKDESIVFPAINKAAGCEVRALPFLHWWTFMGYYQSIDPESLMGVVLSIRQKKQKGKKLEKWEKEFEQNNRELCELIPKKARLSPEDEIKELFKSMMEEGAIVHGR